MNETQRMMNAQNTYGSGELKKLLSEIGKSCTPALSVMSQRNDYSYKGYISSLKWAGSEEFLFRLATECRLNLNVLRVDKKLLRQTIYYEVTGTEKNIDRFAKELSSAAREYNNR